MTGLGTADTRVVRENIPRFEADEETSSSPGFAPSPSAAANLPFDYIHQMFENQATRTPGAVAVVFENQEITYAVLNHRAENLAIRLRELGVERDVPVGICLGRSFDMVIGVLAILKAGGAYVPLDPAYPTDRLKLMMENARLPVLLTHSKWLDRLDFKNPELKVICVDQSHANGHSFHLVNQSALNRTAGIDSPLAYIIHTSGSTGVPKGVAMPHRPLIHLIDWQLKNSSLDEGERTLQFASLSFDVSFQEMFSTWCAGGSLVLIEESLRSDPTALLRFIAEKNIHRIFLPFVALQQFAEAFTEETMAPRCLREIITAGEQLQITPKLVKLFEALPGCLFHNHYGPSESHVVTSFTLSGPPRSWPTLPPIGKPIPSARIHLLDDQHRPIEAGEMGEIWIGGDCLARGYLHRPDLTAEKFISDPFSNDPKAKLYKTGDLGRHMPDGNIEFLGRVDNQVKIRGFRVELGEVEATLRQHSQIRDAVVVAREDRPGNKRLVAYFLSRPNITTTSGELRKFLSEKLPPYMVPSAFVSLKTLPLTPSGKVDRKNLPAPLPERNLDEEFTAPKNPIEEKVTMIWGEVLGMDRIGTRDNFFELGGHSLLATQIISRIHQVFQTDVPVAAVFESPTIESLAKRIEQDQDFGRKTLTPIPSGGRPERLPVSHSQQSLWFLHALDLKSCAYNVPAAVALDGELDVPALQECLNALVQRHQILRTIFPEQEGEPRQVILAESSLPLSFHDLRGASNPESKAQLEIAAQASLPFDVTQGPLLRCSLLRLEHRKYLLNVVMHHIISDGWSLGIFFQELASLYDAKTSLTGAKLPTLSIQYADYALWQRGDSQKELVEKQLTYWKTALAGSPPTLKLPTDHSPSVMNSRGAHCSIHIPTDLVKSIEHLSRQTGCTPFMVMLTSLSVLLHKWSGEDDFVVGTVLAGRTRPELENLIGCFMNFLPLRMKTSGDQTALSLLSEAKRLVLESQAHSDCPFETIVEAVKPERREGQNPIYNVAFLLQNFPQIEFASGKVRGKFVSVETDTALLDLRFVADETPSGLSLTCEYRTNLFKQQTIERLLSSFSKILEALVQHPKQVLKDFVIASELGHSAQKSATIDLIAVTSTFTAEPLAESLEFWLRELELPATVQFAPYNQTFQQLLDPTSLLSSNVHGLNVVLLRFEDWAPHSGTEQLSDLRQKIDRTLGDFISALRSAAGRSSTPYLLCICPLSEAFISHSGQDFHERMYQRVVDELASCTNIQVIFPQHLAELYPVDEIHDSHAEKLGHVPYTSVFFSALATMIVRKFHRQKRLAPKVIVLDCDQTLWAGVSGEDGPEGVRLTESHRALQQFMRDQLEMGRLLCLCSKNNLEDVEAVFARHKDMPLKLDHFVATRINWLPKSENLKALALELNLGVESLVLVDDNPVECAEVTANCPGATALQLPDSPELIPEFLKHCWFFDRQGLTAEDKQRTELYRQERQRNLARTDSMGLADFLRGLDLKVCIEKLKSHEISRAAQLTLRTNQFNCTTRRFSETEIRGLPDSTQTWVVSASDRFGDYGLVGLVMCELSNGSLSVENFLLSCRALGRGIEHKIITHLGSFAKSQGAAYVNVHFVSSAKNKPALDFLENIGGQFRQALNGGYVFAFPADVAADTVFNPGKVEESPALLPSPDRKERIETQPTFNRWRWIALEASQPHQILALVEAKAKVQRGTNIGTTGAATKTEKELCQIWQKLLRLGSVGIEDNFFDLGGNSLLAVRLFSEIEKQLKVKLPLVTVFQSPTVKQLAKAIDQQSSRSQESDLLPIQPNGDLPPLFLVHGAGGDVLWGYANLAHHTNRSQPIYGIQAGGTGEFETLEEMAAHYVETVRAFQPTGPYHLGGYCFGGNVAQEMARQLKEDGEVVAFLAMLDCAPSNCGYETVNWRRPSLVFDFTRNVIYWLEDFWHLKPEQRSSLIHRKLQTLPRKIWGRISGQRSREDFDLEEFIDITHVSDRETRLWTNHLGLLVRHTSKPYGGPLTLFRTRSHPLICSFEDDFGWGKLAPQVTVKNVPGSHEGIFLEPHVRSLAKELEHSLDASRTRSDKKILSPRFA
jgi:amino acid adenylation domain-containing protein/FkbH-like protein